MNEKPIEVTVGDTIYWVKEFEDRIYKVFNMKNNKTYTVNMEGELCDCDDFIHRRQLQNNRRCKHMQLILDNFPKEQEVAKAKPSAPPREPRPTKEGLVLEAPKEYQEYVVVERKDEDQILAEMRGEVLKEYIYSFPSGGREVTGLSYSGVKEVARRMGCIALSDLKIDEREDSYVVQVKATDKIRDFQIWGVAKQLKKMKFRNGTEAEDQFALQKAASKAQRNALRGIIPEKIAVEILKVLIKKER